MREEFEGLPEKSLREQVLQFFQQPVVTRKGLEGLLQKGRLHSVLTSLVMERALLRKKLNGRYFYTRAKKYESVRCKFDCVQNVLGLCKLPPFVVSLSEEGQCEVREARKRV